MYIIHSYHTVPKLELNMEGHSMLLGHFVEQILEGVVKIV